MKESGISRHVRIEDTSEGFVMIIVLMVIFFIGLGALEIAHKYMLGTWNEVIFNGIMLIIGGITGALWGKQNS